VQIAGVNDPKLSAGKTAARVTRQDKPHRGIVRVHLINASNDVVKEHSHGAGAAVGVKGAEIVIVGKRERGQDGVDHYLLRRWLLSRAWHIIDKNVAASSQGHADRRRPVRC
jgi:hypothetical protein